jgi:hypothetical protein
VYHLPEIDIDAGFYLETQVQVHPEDIIRAVGFYFIILLIGIIGGIDADKPVSFRPLRVFIQNGVKDIPVDFLRLVAVDQINHILAA